MCLFRLLASARLQGTIERPQFIGSSIETLLFGIFFYLVMQGTGIFHIFDTLYVFFLLLNYCPRGEKGFAPTLDPIQSLGYKGLANHSVCFESCCSDNTGMAGIQSLSRRQNPSSSCKSHEAFWSLKEGRWGHQKASDGHHQNPHHELERTRDHPWWPLPIRKVGGSRRSLARSARCCAIHHRKRQLEDGDVRARGTG